MGNSLNDVVCKFTIMNSIEPIRDRIEVTPTAHVAVFVLLIAALPLVHFPSLTEILDTSLTEE